jgi:hypothetical protein
MTNTVKHFRDGLRTFIDEMWLGLRRMVQISLVNTSRLCLTPHRRKLMEPKVLTFGHITEQADGKLLFENFHVEGGHNEWNTVVLLKAVISRLEEELLKETIAMNMHVYPAESAQEKP